MPFSCEVTYTFPVKRLFLMKSSYKRVAYMRVLLGVNLITIRTYCHYCILVYNSLLIIETMSKHSSVKYVTRNSLIQNIQNIPKN